MRKGMFYGLLFTAPAILGFAIFTLGPMIASLVLSLTDYNVFKEQTAFVGLDNFTRLFSGEDELFYKSLGITFYFVVLRVPAVILLSFGIALLLNLNVKGRAIFRTIIYLPSIVPAVASAMIWMWLLNPDLGLINSLLSRLHLPTSNWLYGEGSVIPSVVLTTLWGIGSTVIIFLAGLSGIPRQYYEAIEVDGGGWFRKLSHVTVPMVTPTIFFNTIMTIIGSFQVFNEAYILTQGGPNNQSLFYVFYLWRTGFRDAEMGYASALAWILFIIILFFTFIVFRTSKSWVYYEGGTGLEAIEAFTYRRLRSADPDLRHVHHSVCLADPQLADEFVADFHHASRMDTEAVSMEQLSQGADGAAVRCVLQEHADYRSYGACGDRDYQQHRSVRILTDSVEGQGYSVRDPDDQHDAAGGGHDYPELPRLADDGVIRYAVPAHCTRLFRRGDLQYFPAPAILFDDSARFR